MALCAASAQDLKLSRLPGVLPADEVLAGKHDGLLQPSTRAQILSEIESGPRWWKLTSALAVPGIDTPATGAGITFNQSRARMAAWRICADRAQPVRASGT